MQSRSLKFVLALVLSACALVVVACGDSSDEAASAAQEATSEGADQAGGALSAEDLAWGLDWLKATEGKADSSKAPFVIGWANAQGGQFDHPQATIGAKVAVDLINERLGGIDGRPVELKTCFMVSEEDGQRCGAQFLNEKVDIVNVGLAEVGTSSLYETISPRLPVLVANPSAEADTTTRGVYSFSGGPQAAFGAIAVLASRVPDAKQAAVIHSTNPVGSFIASQILKPQLEQAGLQPTLVGVSDTPTAPEVQSAIQAAGAQNARVMTIAGLPPTCIAVAEGLKALGVNTQPIAISQCSEPAVEKALGALPEGWMFTSRYDSARVPNPENGVDTYVGAAQSQGVEEADYLQADAAGSFATVMMSARMAVEAGGKTSPQALAQEITSYRGPMALTAGTAQCGKVSETFIGLCSRFATVQTARDGVMRSLPSIDPSAAGN